MYEEDKNGRLVLIAHYEIEAAGGSAPTPFYFVKPYGVNHLMPALSLLAPADDRHHAALWYRDVNQSSSSSSNIDPVETKTSDPDDPILLVYGMLGDGNCYWHSWAFLLEILSHPWRLRDDALAHDSLGIHKGSKRGRSFSVTWLNQFFRRPENSPSRLVGSEGVI